MLRLAGINIYPVKSCRGVSVERALVESRGLAGDRRFMLVDRNGRFVTQRQHPKMALITTSLIDDGFVAAYPDHGSITVDSKSKFATEDRVNIWRSSVNANIASGEINEWFSEIMGLHCRLAYMSDRQHRAIPHRCAQYEDEVSFADGAPLMMISTASLEDLNARLRNPVEMDRFRPNLIVSGSTAFDEDAWERIRIGDVEVEIAWSCARCLLITVDPQTGQRDVNGEPFETLKTYRREDDGRVMFGQNLIPRRLGELRVDDTVEVIQ